jgi:hypothetical protein
MENDPGVANVGLRKLRSVSGYNIWHSEFIRSQDSKSFTTLAEKNGESGRRWNTLSLEQKSRYRDEAAACSTRFSRHNKKREVSRVLKHLEGIVNMHAKYSLTCILHLALYRVNMPIWYQG